MRWFPVMSMVMAMPALFQLQLSDAELSTQPVEKEARDFLYWFARAPGWRTSDKTRG